MKSIIIASTVTLALAMACASKPGGEPNSANAAPAPAAESEATQTNSAALSPAPAAEPTAEEKKKAEDAKQLKADQEKLEAEQKAELQRLTPELRAQAKALGEKGYPNIRAAVTAALASKHRKPGNSDRDQYRHPLETLEFMGVRPNMTVLEYGPGEGWYTELLAPALGKNGKLLVTAPDAAGPASERSTLYGMRMKYFTERLPELYGKVQVVTVDAKTPKLGLDNSVDLVLSIRNLHGLYNDKQLDSWLGEVHKALRANGKLGIVAHRAKPGADLDQSAKAGYMPEGWVIEKLEQAGFKLEAKSEINANPKDTKDHPEGVWALPPTLKNGDKDRAKFVAIGESDRMTLRFKKVALPKPAAAKPADAKGATPATPATPAAKAADPKAAKPATAATPATPATPAAKPAADPKAAAPATKPATPATPATPAAKPAADPKAAAPATKPAADPKAAAPAAPAAPPVKKP